MDYDNSIWNELNDRQIEAVTSTEGYVRVIAGAGSGKTRALTHRYAYLVKEAGIQTNNILCLTFTNKAANEMRKRIRSIIGHNYDTGYICTYHGFCLRILKEDIQHLFYPQNFTIIDEDDQKLILSEIYEELGIKMSYDSFNNILKEINVFKCFNDYIPLLIDTNKFIDTENAQSLNDKIILMYLKKQKKTFALDYEDLLNFTFKLFEYHPSVLKKWQERIVYIQVDEFQDSGIKQYALIKLLSEINQNLFVVGDPDQNIYGWRGSNNRFILDFDKTFSDVKTIILDRNYRSSPEILLVSNAVIKNNIDRIEKNMFTNNLNGSKVFYYHGRNDIEEGMFISSKIKQIISTENSKLKDFAILYRAHYISRFIEQALITTGIDYTMYSGVKFFERKEIKDALSYLKMIAFSDDISFERIINIPSRQIGKAKMKFIKEESDKLNISYYEVLKRNATLPLFENTGAKNFISVIEKYKECYRNKTVSDVFQLILEESGYDTFLRENGDSDRLENISELLNTICDYERDYGERVSLEDYLYKISLYTNTDLEDKKNGVKLMTIHSAKGLEFPYVFICGLTEGIFPNKRAMNERKIEGLEEERRLMYVAMTRAENKLFLTESEGVGAFGIKKTPSRFIYEIEKQLIDCEGLADDILLDEMQKQIENNNKSLYNNKNNMGLKTGDRIEHPIFGTGLIEEVNEEKSHYIIKLDKNGILRNIDFSFKNLKKINTN